MIAALRDPVPQAAERLASGAGDLAAGIAGRCAPSAAWSPAQRRHVRAATAGTAGAEVAAS
jgi:hypothetical protein